MPRFAAHIAVLLFEPALLFLSAPLSRSSCRLPLSLELGPSPRPSPHLLPVLCRRAPSPQSLCCGESGTRCSSQSSAVGGLPEYDRFCAGFPMPLRKSHTIMDKLVKMMDEGRFQKETFSFFRKLSCRTPCRQSKQPHHRRRYLVPALTPLPLSAVLKETGREHKHTATTTNLTGPLSNSKAREIHCAT